MKSANLCVNIILSALHCTVKNAIQHDSNPLEEQHLSSKCFEQVFLLQNQKEKFQLSESVELKEFLDMTLSSEDSSKYQKQGNMADPGLASQLVNCEGQILLFLKL